MPVSDVIADLLGYMRLVIPAVCEDRPSHRNIPRMTQDARAVAAAADAGVQARWQKGDARSGEYWMDIDGIPETQRWC
jgi:hypothetical protein